MADPINRKVRLPNGEIKTVRVPSDWGPDQVKQALVDAGAWSEPEPVRERSWIDRETAPTIRGVTKAVENLADSLNMIPNKILEMAGSDYRIPKVNLPKQEPVDTLVGQGVESIAQFLTGYGLGGAAIRGAGIVSQGGPKAQYLIGMLKGAVSDAYAFDPKDPMFADVLKDMGVDLKVVDWLSNPDDPESVRRAKRALEGAGFGAAVDGIIRAATGVARGLRGTPKPEPITPSEVKTVIDNKDVTPLTGEPGKKGKSPRYMYQKVVREDLNNQIHQAADEALKGNMDESKRLFQRVAESLEAGDIVPEALPKILEKYNMSPADFAKEYSATISLAGRQLNQLSQLRKRINAVLVEEAKTPEDREAIRSILQNLEQEFERSPADFISNSWQRVENFRRALLVSQLATAVRNAESQTIRGMLSMFDEAQTSIFSAGLRVGLKEIRKLTGKEIPEGFNRTLVQDMKANINAANALVSRFSPEGRERLMQILDEVDVLEATRLISQPVHEVTMGKIANAVNIFNRAQEVQFRKVFFEARLRQNLMKNGMDFDTVKPKDIDPRLVKDAVDYAMEMTFAQAPKSKIVKDLINVWSRTPLTLINPFPRFNFASAHAFVFEHSPLGLLKAANPRLWREAMETGDTDHLARIMSRAAIGSMLIGSAWEIINSDLVGENWYEINAGDGKVVDIRAFAPFSTYFFIAEALKGDESRLKPEDYALMSLGMNRIAGTGLDLFNLFTAEKGETAEKIIQRVAGQYFGSFSVPARTFKDLYDLLDDEESILRDTNQSPWIAPFINNIPEWSQTLPELGVPYGQNPVQTEHPVVRQLTGIGPRSKSDFEREVDRLEISKASVYARTGDPKANNLINRYMGQYSEMLIKPLVESQEYKTSEDWQKKALLSGLDGRKGIIQGAKKLALTEFIIRHPDKFMELEWDKMDEDTQNILLEIDPAFMQKFVGQDKATQERNRLDQLTN